MTGRANDDVVATIIGFVGDIGLEVEAGAIDATTVLPGILVRAGVLVVDRARLRYPGDLLHEAGHLAILTPAERRSCAGALDASGGDEMAAIAWSYAASVHLGIDPAVVFHGDGYRGGAQALVDNFTEGRTIGVPLLQWFGMTLDSRPAERAGVWPYPAMLLWTRGE
ncbi:MAG: hypothetical protein ACT4PW_12060 [Acidimicrobiia bacterium]